MKANSLFKNIPSHVSINIPLDQKGCMLRRCPSCEIYFKIRPGTGLKGTYHCYCPYCGYKADSNSFTTPEQIEYGKSVALNRISSSLIHDLKKLEFNHRPRGAFDIGLSLKVSGNPVPVQFYFDKKLETDVICDHCTLFYAIYGVFAYCPDCGSHNSLLILKKNLEVVEKMLEISENTDNPTSEMLLNSALGAVVSTFDAFGREVIAIASQSPKIATIDKDPISFQNIEGARKKLQKNFNIDIATMVTSDEWEGLIKAFQKRHLLAHKLGVIDEQYVKKTNQSLQLVGRKVTVNNMEIREASKIIFKIACSLSSTLLPKPTV